MRAKQRGLTLVEILIALAIIGALMVLAYPSYQQYLLKSRRKEGQQALQTLALHLERYYATHHTYATATLATGNIKTDLQQTEFSDNHWYRLNITKQTDNSFQLVALAQGSQKADFDCQKLMLNSYGHTECGS